jgi:DNA-binding NarL/FixJ family response regulator
MTPVRVLVVDDSALMRKLIPLILERDPDIEVVGTAMDGAFALRTSLQSQLFGVAPSDPFVLAAVTGLLAFVAVLACVWPANRATRIDPIIALAE